MRIDYDQPVYTIRRNSTSKFDDLYRKYSRDLSQRIELISLEISPDEVRRRLMTEVYGGKSVVAANTLWSTGRRAGRATLHAVLRKPSSKAYTFCYVPMLSRLSSTLGLSHHLPEALHSQPTFNNAYANAPRLRSFDAATQRLW